jgi:hypothetical protein
MQVAPRAAHAPVEVSVLVGARVHEGAVGGHDLHGRDVVERETEPPRESPESPTRRQAADARVRHGAHRRHQAVRRGFVVDEPEQRASGRPGAPRLCVHTHGPHAREVNHQAAIAGGHAREAVAPALDRGQQRVFAREQHGTPHVLDARRLHDECRPFVDGGVEDVTRGFIAVTGGHQHAPPQAVLQVAQRLARERHRAPVAAHGVDVWLAGGTGLHVPGDALPGRQRCGDCRDQGRTKKRAALHRDLRSGLT